MSHSSPALAFPLSSEPLVLTAARELAELIEAGEMLPRARLNAVLSRQFGGSDADGCWSVRDAHAALELAQVVWLRDRADLTPASSIDDADRAFAQLEISLPSQTVRSDEQIELQQFATPPRLAWLLARASALRLGETVLEPSAGTGMLAVWAAKAGARLLLNEISPLRRECLAALFPEATVSGYDGELIDELLDAVRCRASFSSTRPFRTASNVDTIGILAAVTCARPGSGSHPAGGWPPLCPNGSMCAGFSRPCGSRSRCG